ncbi:MAG TPA: succinate dehydrogenase, cytochrome b556 subunit [Alphaproteobacteria bacterium]|jgi:succinate dehydrogenase / fumarate reductase, cytochrome b subunit|nr:succinate dehydrogenase, cytochrome b556 subunit [Alphaproteobacteria bacterium]
MTAHNRPLSPHLQVYRPQWSSVLSIVHRLTGIALSLGLILLVWWIAAAASGAPRFATVQYFIGSFLGRLVLFGWTWALFYHLANGIRHLAWDVGWGFALKDAERSAWLVVAASVVLTFVAWFAGYAAMGGS